MTKTATLETVINQAHQRSQHHFDEVIPVHEPATDSYRLEKTGGHILGMVKS